MARTNFQNFWLLDFDLLPDDILPPISDDVQQTLARLLGWSDRGDRFVRLRASDNGVLFTHPRTVTASIQQATQFTINANPDLVLNANPERLYVLFQNLSANVVELGFTASLSFGSGLQLQAGESYIDTTWQGDIYVSDNGLLTSRCYVQEFVTEL